MEKKLLLLKIVSAIMINVYNVEVKGQCVNPANIHSFVYNGKTYQVVKENKTWINAASCAVEKGGSLVEINDQNEQNAVYAGVQGAGIINSNTVAPDGGGASYVWLGGNDISVEGNWKWDGNNDGTGPQFWQGTFTGAPVGGLYNNWGSEPDDVGSQDALGLALTDWPFGTAGQWNDIWDDNTLYYVIEYNSLLDTNDIYADSLKKSLVYPNPVSDFVTIESKKRITGIRVTDASGRSLKSIPVNNGLSEKIDFTELDNGIYFLEIDYQDKNSSSHKIIKK